MKKIFLIPSPISEGGIKHIPPSTIEQIHKIKFFVVERVRTTRRFIRSIIPDFNLDDITFIQLDKKDDSHLEEIIPILILGEDIGIISECGIPGVADPGSEIVRLAVTDHGYISSPLSGPSSIFMALSSSGFNGQNFTFHGYLPVKENELIKRIRAIGRIVLERNYTQIFIETPYRNDRLFKFLLNNLPSNIALCIARDITGEEELIVTKTIADWGEENFSIGKSPTIFLLGK